MYVGGAGTPNLSDFPRPIPGISVAGPGHTGQPKRTMPREIYEDLTPRGQQICAKIVALDDGDEMERASRANHPVPVLACRARNRPLCCASVLVCVRVTALAWQAGERSGAHRPTGWSTPVRTTAAASARCCPPPALAWSREGWQSS